jgi:hypothetical protein
MNEPKVLVYDLETTPVLAWVWSCGEQVVRHGQLQEPHNQTKIICITYRWLHEKKAKALVFDLKTLSDKAILIEFSKLAREADVIIGKNNARFDDKHVNFRLFQNDLPPIPDLANKSDDLEKWMRRTFNMQSYALDYFAKLRTGEGKIKMEMGDWLDIVVRKDKKALDKMVKYGKKDADDTAELILQVKPYVTPKHSMASFHGKPCCINCGSTNLIKDGTRFLSGIKKQRFFCNDHKGYAGVGTMKKDGTYGVMSK